MELTHGRRNQPVRRLFQSKHRPCLLRPLSDRKVGAACRVKNSFRPGQAFADSRISADQGEGAAHDAAAEDAVKFADAAEDPAFFGRGGDIAEALGFVPADKGGLYRAASAEGFGRGERDGLF